MRLRGKRGFIRMLIQPRRELISPDSDRWMQIFEDRWRSPEKKLSIHISTHASKQYESQCQACTELAKKCTGGTVN